MKVIYKPKGAALEYSELALNLAIGCDNGCNYCYAPNVMFKKREDYFNIQKERKNVLNLLEEDLKEMVKKRDNRKVLLCFISDPYQKGFEKQTREALKLFKEYNKNFVILTKNGSKAINDFDLYKKGDEYATTLTFYDKELSKKWEPNADIPNKRIESLKIAKKNGIKTWVSFEPVIIPEQTYKLFEKSKNYVDKYKIGKINRFKTGYEVDWKLFTEKIIKLMKKNKKNYYIKESLQQYCS